MQLKKNVFSLLRYFSIIEEVKIFMGVSGIDAGGYVCISSRGAPLPLDLELYSRAAQVFMESTHVRRVVPRVRRATLGVLKDLSTSSAMKDIAKLGEHAKRLPDERSLMGAGYLCEN